MPSNHLILCRPLLLPPSISPSIRIFSNESVLCIRWPKYWSFSFSISPSNEYSGLICFKIDRHFLCTSSLSFIHLNFKHNYMLEGKWKPGMMFKSWKTWAPQNKKSRRIDAFELWCWRRLLGVPWMQDLPVHPKGDQSWVFIGRIDAEAETPMLWPPDAKSWLIWKDPDVGRDWGQEKKGTTEDEMVGWHHQLNGHKFE